MILKKARTKTVSKKGMGHVEMILSFVIFLGFLIFVLAIFKPFKISPKSSVYLDVLERGIRDYSSVEVMFLSLKLGDDALPEDATCFCFDYEDLKGKVKVKDEIGMPVDASLSGKKICIMKREDFYNIYSSEEFERGSVVAGCERLEKGAYTLGLFESHSMTSYSLLNNLKNEHENNYESLKSSLGLPSSKDFAFSVRETAGGIILEAKKDIPKVKVLARDIPVQLAKSDGNLEYAMLNIQVW